jgi:hypothetical protein
LLGAAADMVQSSFRAFGVCRILFITYACRELKPAAETAGGL